MRSVRPTLLTMTVIKCQGMFRSLDFANYISCNYILHLKPRVKDISHRRRTSESMLIFLKILFCTQIGTWLYLLCGKWYTFSISAPTCNEVQFILGGFTLQCQMTSDSFVNIYTASLTFHELESFTGSVNGNKYTFSIYLLSVFQVLVEYTSSPYPQ